MAIIPEDKILYTVKEVAQLIHTNQGYVYSLIKAGLLPVLKLGSYKIRKESLEHFLVEYEGKEYRLSAGESFRFEKNGLHSVKADGPYKMALLLVL